MIERTKIDIPDHPILNITRKAQVFRSELNYDLNEIKLKIRVYHYDESGNIIKYMKSDLAELISDNSVRVNPVNGEIIEEPPRDPETNQLTDATIGEFDFLWNIVNVLKIKTIAELEEMYIMLRIEKINKKLYGII